MDYEMLIPVVTALVGLAVGWGLPKLAAKTKNKTDDKLAEYATRHQTLIVKTVEGLLRRLAKEDVKAAEQKVEVPRPRDRDHRK